MCRTLLLTISVCGLIGGCTMLPPKADHEQKSGQPPEQKPDSLDKTKDKDQTLAEATSDTEKNSKVNHAAVDAEVDVSSTHSEYPGEGPPSHLIDGDLSTRWSSDYESPQKIIIDLGQPMTIKKAKLHWESAAASTYTVLTSGNGNDWTNVSEKNKDQIGPREDIVSFDSVKAQYIKFNLEERISAKEEWGFSLYEIEVIASP